MIYQGKARYPVHEIVVHCTATPSDWRPNDTSLERVEAIRQMHVLPKPKGRGWRNIGYHWLIDRDDTVLPGRSETEIGAGVLGHNNGVIHIALFGGKTSKPTDHFLMNYTARQEVALIRLIANIKARTKIIKTTGHNQYDSGKACPGFNVPKWLEDTLQ